MSETFRTPGGDVPAVTAAEMREVDRVAVADVGVTLLQMMENAGRGLARAVRYATDGPVTVLAGNGGNGGGGLVCARHLANRGREVRVVTDRSPDELEGAAAHQHGILSAMDVPVTVGPDAVPASGPVVDALVGYGLTGPLGGTAAEMATALADDGPVVSLDVPSGVDATTGDAPGPHVRPDLTVTLALPKTGLTPDQYCLLLADIGLPAVVFRRAGIDYRNPFDGGLVTLQG
ncbi:NAD(P)H-hydrate epimerase [Halorientalis litorea]|uniref:NAD(P)H-hydrate epimerase n=1 Tax=Halorientalis litorea TaxID=2931977 RepID=UPI001FF47DCD|nr:NAD(P)H-hydrate epimerase [Halorientalis litorea]